jgi:cystathionine beta-lyase/cystathionine gamma-synthase
LARRQQHGFGGMVSFQVAGGLAEANHVLRAVKTFTLAESLGACPRISFSKPYSAI